MEYKTKALWLANIKCSSHIIKSFYNHRLTEIIGSCRRYNALLRDQLGGLKGSSWCFLKETLLSEIKVQTLRRGIFICLQQTVPPPDLNSNAKHHNVSFTATAWISVSLRIETNIKAQSKEIKHTVASTSISSQLLYWLFFIGGALVDRTAPAGPVRNVTSLKDLILLR